MVNCCLWFFISCQSWENYFMLTVFTVAALPWKRIKNQAACFCERLENLQFILGLPLSVLTALFCVCQRKQKTVFQRAPLVLRSLTPRLSLPFQQATASSKPPRSQPSSSRPTASPPPRPPPSPGSRSSCRRSSPRSTRGAATPRSPTPPRPPSPRPTAAPRPPRRPPAPTSRGQASPLRPAAPWPPRPAGPTPTPATGLPSAPRATPSRDLATGKEVPPGRAWPAPAIPPRQTPGFVMEIPQL